jgi:transcriptional regulator of heat shock response
MENRKAAILEEIIVTYIATAGPVGSRYLTEHAGFDVSAATIRNEMVELERDGYLTHPHTSAGRVPTAKAYRFFLEQCVDASSVRHDDASAIEEAMADAREARQIIKSIAKAVAERTHEAVVVAFSPDDLYYTGLTHVFAQPEFQGVERVVHLSEVLDHLEEVMASLPRVDGDDVLVAIDSESPFGDGTATALIHEDTESGSAFFGVIGPMRMPYQTIVPLTYYVQNHFRTHIHNI